MIHQSEDSQKLAEKQIMMRKYFQICFVFWVCLSIPLIVFAMTVEEAYKAIPHERTLFDSASSKISQNEKEYLNTLFALIDRAIVVKVQTLEWLRSNRQIKLDNEKYDKILQEFKNLTVPVKLEKFHQLVLRAVESQKLFFEKWSKRNWFNYDIFGDEQVQSSSADLKQAYNILIGLYPIEIDQNKKAFFDYLCALDFL